MVKKWILFFSFFGPFQFYQLAMAVSPEDIVKYRQGILFGMGWNVGAMGSMVKVMDLMPNIFLWPLEIYQMLKLFLRVPMIPFTKHYIMVVRL